MKNEDELLIYANNQEYKGPALSVPKFKDSSMFGYYKIMESVYIYNLNYPAEWIIPL